LLRLLARPPLSFFRIVFTPHRATFDARRIVSGTSFMHRPPTSDRAHRVMPTRGARPASFDEPHTYRPPTSDRMHRLRPTRIAHPVSSDERHTFRPSTG
jgi:hypothetical protein